MQERNVALKMTNREVAGASVVALDGRIVLGEESQALRVELKNLVAAGKRKIVLNMDNIKYIDNAGLGILVAAHVCAKAQGASLTNFSKLTDKAAAEKPRVTLAGTVERIIQSTDPSIPEKAEISVEGTDELYQEIRIENALTDGHGDEVRLEKGALST